MQRFSTYLLAAFIVIVLAMQTRLLYTFPAPDSARWWGDETGQMLELRAELQTGHACIPHALGSSLEVSNGVVRSNSWLAAIVYGLPVLVFAPIADVVTIGRSVTLLLSLALCAIMFLGMRKFSVTPPIALLAILLLVSSRSFFFASHAARLDVAVGIAVLLFSVYLSNKFEHYRAATWQPSTRWCFTYGAIGLLSATLSIHLLTLIGMLSLMMLWRFGIWRKPRLLVASIGGVASVAVLLLATYLMSGAPLTLFSASAKPNQFQSVAAGLPVLRPFSRSVQIANLLERLNGLWSETPAILLLAVVLIAVALTIKPRTSRSARANFLTVSTVAILLAWLILQSPALYYYVHILPLVVVFAAIAIERRVQIRQSAVIAAGLLLAILAVRDTIMAAPLAGTIAKDNNAAIAHCLESADLSGRPIVLAQNPAIAALEHRRDLQLMTAHFLDFPVRNESPGETLRRLGVCYLLLYAPADDKSYSSDYAALRPLADSIGIVRALSTGILLDARRDYFGGLTLEAQPKDTLILYELAR